MTAPGDSANAGRRAGLAPRPASGRRSTAHRPIPGAAPSPVREFTGAPWMVAKAPGLSPDRVLRHELESLDWRLERMESALFRLLRGWMWLVRLYRRLGHMALRSPAAGICHRLMGRIAADEQYRRWFIQHQATDPYAGGAAISEPDGPLISLLMPIYRPNLVWLRAAVDSVRGQTYPNWELLMVCDGMLGEEVAAELRAVTALDPRIQCLPGPRAGISATLNRGLDACRGGYTAVIDQDDVLETTALAHVAAAIAESGPDLVYTDEDYVNEDGVGHLPLFKPGWSPALLLSCMYLGHLVVAATERIRSVGGFRGAYDGAQDYDLALRLADGEVRAVHVLHVLYHWRRHAGSTALGREAKPHAHEAGRRALEDALQRRGIGGAVRDGRAANHYRIARRFVAEDAAAIIVPTRNPRLLARLLGSMPPAGSGPRREVYAILHCQGNRRDEEIAAVARKFGAGIFEYRGPFNFALMNNLAVERVCSPYLVLMNDDVVVRGEDWLEELCAPFARKEVGIVGARLHYPDGTIEHAGVVTGIGDGVGHAGRFQLESPFWPWLGATRNVSAVTGACMAVRRSVFLEVGGFDTRYFNNYNDVDLCFRVQGAGYEVVLNAGAEFRHDGGRTRSPGAGFRERMDFWTQWGNVIGQVDYFYSPNLSRRLEAIELCAPCRT